MPGNRQIIIDSIPDGHLRPDHFRMVDSDVPTPGADEALCRTILLSIDPANRAWMRMRTYRDQLQAGEVMAGFTLSEVLEPNGSGLERGAIVYSEAGWQEYAALNADTLPTAHEPRERVRHHRHDRVLRAARCRSPAGGRDRPRLGVGRCRGSVAGQIAKIKGCRVVGVAGSDEKTRLVVDELGFDAAINRHSLTFEDDLRVACPDGFGLYFDNAAGPLLETALAHLEPHGRVVCCGAAGLYDAAEMTPPRNVPAILTANRLLMQGFTVLDYVNRFGEGYEDLSRWIDEGRIKVLEDVSKVSTRPPTHWSGCSEGPTSASSSCGSQPIPPEPQKTQPPPATQPEPACHRPAPTAPPGPGPPDRGGRRGAHASVRPTHRLARGPACP
jgi:NADPH-dependent curcumin reductase CurA